MSEVALRTSGGPVYWANERGRISFGDVGKLLPPRPRRRPMASRKRYRLEQVAVEAGEVRRGKWTFAKGGRQAPVRGNEHLY
jgi:hypothetical protein